MASKAVEVDAAGEPVRVTSPDRVIYPATDSTAEVTKQQVVEYYVSVADGILRALGDRPTALERWTTGVHPGITLATGRGDKSDAFYSKRVPKGAPSYVETTQVTFPSGRTAEEVKVANLATVGWCAQMGTITFHPWPTRARDNDHPDELRIDLDPQPGTTFTDAVRVAGVARELLEELGITGYPKTSGNRGVHVYVRIEPRWEFTDLRHAAIGFGRELERRDSGCHDGLVEGGARRAHLRRLQPEQPRPHHRLRLLAATQAGGPRLDPDDLGGAGHPHRPSRLQPLHRPGAGGRRRPLGRHRRHVVLAGAAAGPVGGAARGRAQLPARLPEDARGATAGCSQVEKTL